MPPFSSLPSAHGSPSGPQSDLVREVARSTGLAPAVAARLVADVVSYFDEPVESYVRRRHASLQSGGLRNTAIFEQIATELGQRVVAPPQLSTRQLRRIVYG